MENLELHVEIMPPIASEPPEKRHCSENYSSGTPTCFKPHTMRSIVNHVSQGAADV